MAFALTFIYVVFDIILSPLFQMVWGVLLLAVAIAAFFSYVKILSGRW